jgi:hypothetical protein
MSAGDNSSSSTDESRSSTAPPPPPPPCSPSSPSPSDSLHPAREPFYQTVRRFSDMQFSTLLHSLIGLPSMIAPPSSTGWAVENAKDGEEAVGSPSSLSNSHRSHRSVSDAILEDAQKPPSESKEDGKSQNDDDSGGGGVGLSHTASKLSSSSPSPKANTANIPPPPTSSPQSRESRERMDIGKVFFLAKKSFSRC